MTECPTSWTLPYIDQGLLCLAEACHETHDPKPNTLSFDVPTDRHVAQRNLHVQEALTTSTSFHHAFEMDNPSPEVDLDVNGQTGLTLVGRLEGEAALVAITQEVDGEEVGGMGLFVYEAAAEQSRS